MIFLCDNFVKISVMKRHSLRALTVPAAKTGPLPTDAGSGEWLSVPVHTHTPCTLAHALTLTGSPPALCLTRTPYACLDLLTHRPLHGPAHTLPHTTHRAHASRVVPRPVFTLAIPVTPPPPHTLFRASHSRSCTDSQPCTRFWVRATPCQALCWALAYTRARRSAQDSREDAQMDRQPCFLDVTACCCPVRCRGSGAVCSG